MPLQSFVVRKLTQVGPPVREERSFDESRDPLGNAASMAGAVYEVDADEVRLSAAEIARSLEARRLRSTDLIMIDGTWTTLAESPPFSELAEPYARQERRKRNLRSALILFACLASTVGINAFFIWFF